MTKVVGFDFGTTNSLISIIEGDKPINFLDNEVPFPSVVCYEGVRTIIGREAKEKLGTAGLGVHGNTVRSPKMLLGKESVFIEGVERNPVDIVAALVRYVRNQVTNSIRWEDHTRTLNRVVVTIPVSMEGHRRRALREAFYKADMNIVQFIHEPLAALYGHFRSSDDPSTMLRRYDRQLVLVFDWGGGTLDLTLCRLIDGMLYQVANDGTDEVGGDVFDDTIKNEILKRVMVAKGFDETVQIHPDALSRLLHRCERAKIDLSSRQQVTIYLNSFFRNVPQEDFDYTISRNEIEEITKAILDKGFRRIARIIEAAEVSPAQISLCLATGGMVNMPAIKERLHEWFGPQRVHISDRSGTLVAEGAAWIAHDQAKLCLSKNVELLLARNSYMPLIPAGTEMPNEGEVKKEVFNLYCSDPRDGFAKFQIQSMVRPGQYALPNDKRNPLGNLIIKVDKEALPFRERLELIVSIDEDLILKADAQSLNIYDRASTEIHDLEFGLSFEKNQIKQEIFNDSLFPVDAAGHEEGSVVMRSNIADQDNSYMVPGELLVTYDPAYFDVRNSPPQIQIEEQLYYTPCSRCGRRYNDPLCKCNDDDFPQI
jgi:molecular chaperone DnaK (HSP70)